jgi:hypothetical protein
MLGLLVTRMHFRSMNVCPVGYDISAESWREGYIASFYWACMTLTTIGYGDIVRVMPCFLSSPLAQLPGGRCICS